MVTIALFSYLFICSLFLDEKALCLLVSFCLTKYATESNFVDELTGSGNFNHAREARGRVWAMEEAECSRAERIKAKLEGVFSKSSPLLTLFGKASQSLEAPQSSRWR